MSIASNWLSAILKNKEQLWRLLDSPPSVYINGHNIAQLTGEGGVRFTRMEFSQEEAIAIANRILELYKED